MNVLKKKKTNILVIIFIQKWKLRLFVQPILHSAHLCTARLPSFPQMSTVSQMLNFDFLQQMPVKTSYWNTVSVTVADKRDFLEVSLLVSWCSWYSSFPGVSFYEDDWYTPTALLRPNTGSFDFRNLQVKREVTRCLPKYKVIKRSNTTDVNVSTNSRREENRARRFPRPPRHLAHSFWLSWTWRLGSMLLDHVWL